MREAWESLIRDFVRHIKGTDRTVSARTIYRRATLGLIQFLNQDGQLPAPQMLTRRYVEAYMAHLIDTRSATATVVYRTLQQLMRWTPNEEEIDRSPMERVRPSIVPEKPVPVLTEAVARAAGLGQDRPVRRPPRRGHHPAAAGHRRLSEVAGLA